MDLKITNMQKQNKSNKQKTGLHTNYILQMSQIFHISKFAINIDLAHSYYSHSYKIPPFPKQPNAACCHVVFLGWHFSTSRKGRGGSIQCLLFLLALNMSTVLRRGGWSLGGRASHLLSGRAVVRCLAAPVCYVKYPNMLLKIHPLEYEKRKYLYDECVSFYMRSESLRF